MRKGKVISLLMGIEGDTGVEMLAAEAFLSGERFPVERLSQQDAELYVLYESWLQKRSPREAHELAVASLLSQTLPLLETPYDETPPTQLRIEASFKKSKNPQRSSADLSW